MRSDLIRCGLSLLLFAAVPAAAQEVESVQSSGAVLVDAPPPISPPTLLDEDPRMRRAQALITRVEVFDAAAARLARQLARVLVADQCAASGALTRGLGLVLRTSSEALDTVDSGLAVLAGVAWFDLLRDRAEQARSRRLDARRAAPPLVARQEGLCPDTVADPTPWVPDEPVPEERVVLFVRSGPGDVVWVGGHPAGAADGAGWSAVVAPVGDVQLCAGPALGEACAAPVRITATQLAAYDLSPLKD